MALANNRRLGFHRSAASLKDMATVNSAIAVWRAELVKNGYKIDSLKCIFPLSNPVIRIPALAEKPIDRCMRQMKKSLVHWMEFHFLRVFYPQTKTYNILKYYDFIFWRFDGTIDFERTARNLVACNELNKVTKFRIACVYCFELDVRTLWPDVRSDENLREIDFITDPLVCYWTFRLDDKSTTMDSQNRDSVANKIIQGYVADTASALLYLWDNCEPHEQGDRAINLVMGYSEEGAKNLLPMMDESQLDAVITRAGPGVLRALAKSPEDAKYALQVWNYMKSRVSGDIFIYIFDEIGKLNWANAHLAGLLFDIWCNATDELRNYAIKHYLDGIIHLFCDRDRHPLKNLPRDLRLMCELLSYKSQEERHRFWCDEWYDLIIGVSAASLDELMKLCFASDKEIAAFKKIHLTDYVKIQYYSELLMSKGYFEELNEFLNFCSPDRNVVAGLKKKILWSEKFVKFYADYFHDSAKIHSYHDFVKDMQPLSRNRINLHGQIIVSYWNNGYVREIITARNVQSVKNLVCSFLTRENDMKKAKKIIKQTCYRILSTGNFREFDAREWDDVLLWCMNNDKQQLEKFKESLPVEDFLNILLAKWFEVVEDSLTNRPQYDPDDFSNHGIYEFYDNSSDSDSTITVVDENVSLDDPRDIRTPSTAHFDQKSNANNDTIRSENDVIDKDVDSCIRISALDQFNMPDNFLTWCCSGNKAKIKQLKMMQLSRYDVPPLSIMFQPDNVRITKVVLDWFFNGHKKKIEKYMSILNLKR